MTFVKDFQAFIKRGNVVDLAVAVVIGAAFGRVVNSCVNDLIMPPLGFAVGMVDFKHLQFVLKEAHLDGTGGVSVRYGSFIAAVLDYLIVSLSVFFVVKVMAKMNLKKEKVQKVCPECAMEIPTSARRCPHCSTKLETYGSS